MTGARKRSPLILLLALVGAVLVNVALFSLVTLLSQERAPQQDEIDATGVSLVSLKPPEPPEQEEVKEPKPPEPKQELDFEPDLTPPALDLGAPGLAGGIAINLGLSRLDDGMDQNVVFNAYELDTQPEAIMRNVQYPYKARESGIEGVVQLKLLVNKDGTVGKVEVLGERPEGMEFGTQVEKDAVNWKFTPGRIAGEAVTAWVVTNVRFEL
ncbi:MAG TPA: energy transducer TonB [Candidatus Krumholzibacteria bacterium]|nr:energy transducer TonB [Candidatus Krumholzibacteria bacterium]